MSTPHPTREEIARYVVAALEPPAMERLEEHLATCPECARALAAEARFEVALWKIVPAAREEGAVVPLPHRLAPRRRTWLAVGSSSAGLAAAVLLCLSLWRGHESVRSEMPDAGILHTSAGLVMPREECRAVAVDADSTLCTAGELMSCNIRSAAPAVCVEPTAGACDGESPDRRME
jgi:anti-sigma factor RsiW